HRGRTRENTRSLGGAGPSRVHATLRGCARRAGALGGHPGVSGHDQVSGGGRTPSERRGTQRHRGDRRTPDRGVRSAVGTRPHQRRELRTRRVSGGEIMGAGRVLFAAVMIWLGVLGFINGDFVQIWQPVPKWVPAREALAYLCALISLASGIGLLWQRTAAVAARLIFASLT